MKTMTCKQLGGACDLKITGEIFEEVAKKSQEHGAEMAAIQDDAHLEVMENMKEIMKDPEAMDGWKIKKENLILYRKMNRI
jgi:hypothetical protein